MQLHEYEAAALRTVPPEQEWKDTAVNAALGLAGESGEFADLVKKAVFHGHDWPADKIVKELGDVLWYVTVAAVALGFSLEEIAETNIDKLRKRYPEGFSSERSINRSDS